MIWRFPEIGVPLNHPPPYGYIPIIVDMIPNFYICIYGYIHIWWDISQSYPNHIPIISMDDKYMINEGFLFLFSQGPWFHWRKHSVGRSFNRALAQRRRDSDVFVRQTVDISEKIRENSGKPGNSSLLAHSHTNSSGMHIRARRQTRGGTFCGAQHLMIPTGHKPHKWTQLWH